MVGMVVGEGDVKVTVRDVNLSGEKVGVTIGIGVVIIQPTSSKNMTSRALTRKNLGGFSLIIVLFSLRPLSNG